MLRRGLGRRRQRQTVAGDGLAEQRMAAFRRWPVSDAGSAGALSLPITHAARPQALLNRDHVEAKDVQTLELWPRFDVAYYVPVMIDSPPQTLSVQIDTGSFELWVNPDCQRVQQHSDFSFCQANGHYDPAQSSTSTPLNSSKQLRYGIGVTNVSYFTDQTVVGSGPGQQVMNQVQFGVASASQQQSDGILGLGFGRGVTIPYMSFMDKLEAEGVTRTKTLAIALGAKEQGAGSLTFGGFDRSKYKGRIAGIHIIPAAESPDKVPRYWVALRGIAHTAPGTRPTRLDDSTMLVFLDSGATLTLLPGRIVRAMAAALDSKSMLSGMLLMVDCGLVDQDGFFDFVFDGVTIFVPYREMIRVMSVPGRDAGSDSVCALGVMESDKFALLGDTFMRSAYIVFNLDTSMTYIGRAADCGSDMITISRGNSNLDGAEGYCDEPVTVRRRADGGRDPQMDNGASGLEPDPQRLAIFAVGATAFVLAVL